MSGNDKEGYMLEEEEEEEETGDVCLLEDVQYTQDDSDCSSEEVEPMDEEEEMIVEVVEDVGFSDEEFVEFGNPLVQEFAEQSTSSSVTRGLEELSANDTRFAMRAPPPLSCSHSGISVQVRSSSSRPSHTLRGHAERVDETEGYMDMPEEELPPVEDFVLTPDDFDNCGIPMPLSWFEHNAYRPHISLYFPVEAFSTPTPRNFMEDLNREDRTYSHLRSILANIMLAFSDHLSEKEEEIVAKEKEFTQYKNGMLRSFTNHRVRSHIRSNDDDDAAEEENNRMSEARLQLAEDQREHSESISKLTDMIGKCEIIMRGDEEDTETVPSVMAMPYFFNGLSGKCNGVFLFIWIFDDDIDIGTLLMRRITRNNKSDLRKGRTKGRVAEKQKYNERDGFYNFLRVKSLAGIYGDETCWADLVDRYFGEGDVLCKRSHLTASMFAETDGGLFVSDLHPQKAFTFESAIALAKKSTHSVMESQATFESLFKVSAKNRFLKLVVKPFPLQASLIEIRDFNVLNDSVLPLPTSYGGSPFSFLHSTVTVNLNAVTSSVELGENFYFDEDLQMFMAKPFVLDCEHKEVLASFIKLEKTAAALSAHDIESLPFPPEVIARKQFLKTRAQNMALITYIKKNITLCREKMEKVYEEISKIYDDTEMNRILDRIELWKDNVIDKKGFTELQYEYKKQISTEDPPIRREQWKYDRVTAKFATDIETKLFSLWVTFLLIRESLKEIRLELSDRLWAEVRRCREEPSKYSEAWNSGYEWFDSLPRTSIFPDNFTRWEELSDFGSLLVYTASGFNKLLTMIEGKPVTDCCLLSFVYTAAGIFLVARMAPNIIIAGPYASSKSKTVKEVAATFFPGLVAKDDYHTAKADLTGEDDIYKVRVTEEANLTMMGRDSHTGKQNDSESNIEKNLLTSDQLSTRQAWVTESGKRINQDFTSRKNLVKILLSNVLPPSPNSPLGSRYIILQVLLTERADKPISAYEFALTDPRGTPEKEEFILYQKLLNWYTFFLQRWNEALLVDDCTMAAALVVLRLFCDALRDNGVVGESGAFRIKEMCLTICMAICFKTAIWRTIFTEYGLVKLYHKGTATVSGGNLLDPTKITDFDPRFFVEHVNPHLTVTPEQVFWVLTSISQTFTPMVSLKVLESLKSQIGLNTITATVSADRSSLRIDQFATINKFAEVLAHKKMSPQTVLAAFEELKDMYEIVPSEDGSPAKRIPYLTYAKDSSKNKYVFSFSNKAIERVCGSPVAKLESDIMQCIKQVTNHLYAKMPETYITAFFYTHYIRGHITRFHGLYSVLKTDVDVCNIAILENAIVMLGSDERMFHSGVRTESTCFSLGLKKPVDIIDEDFQMMALRNRMEMLGFPLDEKYHTVNWVKYCKGLRDHPTLPEAYKSRLKRIELLHNYPFSVVREIVDQKREYSKVKASIAQTKSILKSGELMRKAERMGMTVREYLNYIGLTNTQTLSSSSSSSRGNERSPEALLADHLVSYGSSSNRSFYRNSIMIRRKREANKLASSKQKLKKPKTATNRFRYSDSASRCEESDLSSDGDTSSNSDDNSSSSPPLAFHYTDLMERTPQRDSHQAAMQEVDKLLEECSKDETLCRLLSMKKSSRPRQPFTKPASKSVARPESSSAPLPVFSPLSSSSSSSSSSAPRVSPISAAFDADKIAIISDDDDSSDSLSDSARIPADDSSTDAERMQISTPTSAKQPPTRNVARAKHLKNLGILPSLSTDFHYGRPKAVPFGSIYDMSTESS